MNRAYSVLEVKAADDSSRKFTGIASTPSTDRMGDIVEPKGAVFKLPIPLLWQHDSKDPVGWVTKAKVTKDGIEVEGEIAKVDEPGELQNRLLTAWQMLKSKLVRGLSIGFNSIEHEPIEGTYGLKFKKWEWLELSAVTIPANQEASITAIKSIDQKFLAASGRKSSAVAGNPKRSKSMKTIHEQLSELEEMRETKHARMREIADAVEAEERTFNDEEADEFDGLDAEVKELESQIRMKKLEARSASTAKAVNGDTQREASRSRGPDIYVKGKHADKDEDFRGQNFTRYVIAKAVAHMEGCSPMAVVNQRWAKEHPHFARVMKAAVDGAISSTAGWAEELVHLNRWTGDFIEELRAKTVYDQLPLREIPANVNIPGTTGMGGADWVGEGKAIKPYAGTVFDVELKNKKVGGIVIMSNEVLRDSSPAAEMIARDAMTDKVSQRIDLTMFSTGNGAGVAPAGLFYDPVGSGVLTPLTSLGNDFEGVRSDIGQLYQKFIEELNASGLVVVTSRSLAKKIQLMTNTMGNEAFPGVTQDGGTLLGDRLVTGDNINPAHVVLLKPSDIYKIGDRGIEVSISRDATIEMDDGPEQSIDPAAGPGSDHKFVNMYQTDSTAIRITRTVNYAKRRRYAVQYINDADYGAIETT